MMNYTANEFKSMTIDEQFKIAAELNTTIAQIEEMLEADEYWENW